MNDLIILIIVVVVFVSFLYLVHQIDDIRDVLFAYHRKAQDITADVNADMTYGTSGIVPWKKSHDRGTEPEVAEVITDAEGKKFWGPDGRNRNAVVTDSTNDVLGWDHKPSDIDPKHHVSVQEHFRETYEPNPEIMELMTTRSNPSNGRSVSREHMGNGTMELTPGVVAGLIGSEPSKEMSDTSHKQDSNVEFTEGFNADGYTNISHEPPPCKNDWTNDSPIHPPGNPIPPLCEGFCGNFASCKDLPCGYGGVWQDIMKYPAGNAQAPMCEAFSEKKSKEHFVGTTNDPNAPENKIGIPWAGDNIQPQQIIWNDPKFMQRCLTTPMYKFWEEANVTECDNKVIEW